MVLVGSGGVKMTEDVCGRDLGRQGPGRCLSIQCVPGKHEDLWSGLKGTPLYCLFGFFFLFKSGFLCVGLDVL